MTTGQSNEESPIDQDLVALNGGCRVPSNALCGPCHGCALPSKRIKVQGRKFSLAWSPFAFTAQHQKSLAPCKQGLELQTHPVRVSRDFVR